MWLVKPSRWQQNFNGVKDYEAGSQVQRMSLSDLRSVEVDDQGKRV